MHRTRRKKGHTMSENFKAFLELDNSQYINENEYVLIVKEKVVAHGKDAESFLSKARKRFPGETPLIAKIPSEGVLVF